MLRITLLAVAALLLAAGIIAEARRGHEPHPRRDHRRHRPRRAASGMDGRPVTPPGRSALPRPRQRPSWLHFRGLHSRE